MADDPTDARRLRSHYCGWLLPDTVVEESAYSSGMVVIDANVLLALYEVGAAAREEVLMILTAVADRLWVPHQVAVEYSRNRRGIVEKRLQNFSDVRKQVRAAEAAAVKSLVSAVERVESLRRRNRTARQWDLVENELDENSLKRRLDGVKDAILAEVDLLSREHDLRPEDILRDDPVFVQIDELLAGRIGRPIDDSRLRRLVQDAIEFRFPNDIPPGHADGSKTNDLLKSGDYLLWRQLLDHAKDLADRDEVLLITAETKPDWWEKRNNKIIGPRPELVQEMSDEAGKRLVLATFADFLANAADYLATTVSDDTLQEVRDAQVEANRSALWLSALRESEQVDIYELPPWRLVELVMYLFMQMGYRVVDTGSDPRTGFDLIIIEGKSEAGAKPIGVEVKQHRYVTPSASLYQLDASLAASGIERGILVTTGRLSEEASDLPEAKSIQVIDSKELGRLLETHLGVSARFGRKNKL